MFLTCIREIPHSNVFRGNQYRDRDYYYYYIFTAIGFAPGDSSPTLVQTKTIKQQYTVVQHNKIKCKQHNKTQTYNNTYSIQHTIIRTQNNKMRTQYNKIQ
jgi:hypothetical protein